ncbi:MAG TPA: aminoglycoside phosphotransferase family protein [Anaerolineae bacterium]
MLSYLHLPDDFVRTTVDLFADEGIAWLERLPALIAECEQRWSLTVQPPFPLSYNYVAPAVRADGTEMVMKLGVPNPELLREMAALQLCDGRGMVRLLQADAEQGILLLERLRPGTPLARLEDDEAATAIAAGVMQQLWRPLPAEHPFPPVSAWAAGLGRLRAQFDGGTGPFPASLVELAEKLFAELLASSTEPVLLHGDLHHDNILSAQRQLWLALDPKGVTGEPAYEVGALLRNPMPEFLNRPNPGRAMARRVDLLAEILGFARSRIIGWGIAQAVLSAWWTFEDHGHIGDEALICAELLLDL